MSTIVGRESEIAVIGGFLTASDRSVATLAIVGEPGIGKTILWEEAVRQAREQDAMVLVSRPTEAEAWLSFAGLTDLLDGVGAEAFEALPGPQRSALEVALLRAETDRAPEARTVATALLSLLRGLAADGLVVIAVDDVHWLDPPSAAALEFAARRLVGEPFRMVVSLRAEHAGTADANAERLDVGPLSVASLHRIVAERLGTAFPRPVLVRLARDSGGNPLHALEMARLLTHQATEAGAALPVPDDLRALVADRVAALPARTRAELLRVAALARPEVGLVDAAALAKAEEADLVRIVPGGRIEFVHPLFASAVYSAAPLSRRRMTHAALAELVQDAEERARHLALAAAGPDAAVAREVAEAARRAHLRGAPEAAAELTELALRLTPGGRKAAGLRLELAEYLYLASDFRRAGALLEELRGELDPGDLRAKALMKLAEIEYWSKGESVAVAIEEEALAEARDPTLRARLLAAIAMHAGTADLRKAADAAREALALIEQLPEVDPALHAMVLTAHVRADLFLGGGLDLEAAERALAIEQQALPTTVDNRVVFKLAQWLRYVDDFDGARARLVEVEQAAHDEGDESSLANILLNRMLDELWAGDWAEAAVLAERMDEAFAQRGVETHAGRIWKAHFEAYVGTPESVARIHGGDRPSEPIGRMLWARNIGLAELVAGEHESADRHLQEAVAVLELMAFREPAVWRVVGDAIEAAVAAGELERAEALTAEFEERAAASRIPWSLAVSARCRALLMASSGDLDGAAAKLEQALAEHEHSPMPFERARTLLVRGQVLRRLKQKRLARLALEEALATFEGLGAPAWAARAQDELRRTSARRAPTGLSETELRIAELAAAGLTNQAIASEVFVTRKTVEANLARAYRKLGIRSRAQLARALDSRDS